MDSKTEMIDVFNVNAPGKVSRVKRLYYEEMRRCLLELVPSTPPGLTESEMLAAVRDLVSQELFPGGDKVGWWMKAVQLDLEARKLLSRVKGKQTRWYHDPSLPEQVPEASSRMVPVRRELQELPDFMKDRLQEAGLLEAYQDRPTYQRNDYITWVSGAKRPDTREKRLNQMLEELQAGDLYMNMEYSSRK